MKKKGSIILCQIIIGIILFLVSSCNENKKSQEAERIDTVQPAFKLSHSDYVVFNYQPIWHWTFSNAKPSQLSQQELIEIEQILKIAIESYNDIQKNNVNAHNRNNPNEQITKSQYEVELNDYKRQYVPIINEEGQKEVWINFFCEDFDEDWTTELILVEDGGNCFFNIKINLTTKEYYQLEVNYAL